MDLSTLSDERIILAYRTIRDRKEAREAEHKAEIAPYTTQMRAIETELIRRMNEREQNSTATDAGTAYKQVASSVKVVNSGTFLDWLKETGNWNCADIRGAKKEVESYLEEHQSLPPGLDISRVVKCGVRKPTGVK